MNIPSIYNQLKPLSLNAPKALSVARELIAHLQIEHGTPRDERMSAGPHIVRRAPRLFGLIAARDEIQGDHYVDVKLDHNDVLTVTIQYLDNDAMHWPLFNISHTVVSLSLHKILDVVATG